MSASTQRPASTPQIDQNKERGKCMRTLGEVIGIIIIFLVLILGLSWADWYGDQHHSPPPFQFQLDSLTLNPMSSNYTANVTGSNLNLILSVQNKIPIKFKSLGFVLSYHDGDPVVESEVYKFTYRQDKRDQIKDINMGSNVSNDSVIYKDLLRSNNDGLMLNVEFMGSFWTNYGYWAYPLTLHECDLNVVCQNIRVTPLPSLGTSQDTMTPGGSMVGGPIHCKYSLPNCYDDYNKY